MIELTGSEKQISWASEIRAKFVENCDKVIAKVQAGQASYIHPKVRARFCEMVAERREKVLAIAEAARIIDLRNSLNLSGTEQTIVQRVQTDEKAKAAMAAPRQREVQA